MSTFIAILLTAWVWLPGIIQIFNANRLEHNRNLQDIFNAVWIFFPNKWIKLINMGIPFSFFVVYFARKRWSKSFIFFSYVIGILTAPILLESTNLLWHGGSYEGFTMRFSYMLTFWVLVSGSYSYLKIITDEEVNRSSIRSFCAMFCCVLMVLEVVIQYIWLERSASVFQIIILIIVTMGLNILLVLLKPKYYEMVIHCVIILQSIVLAVVMIQVTWDMEESWVKESNLIYQNEKPQDNPLYRVKSMDYALTHNYPLVMKRNAASNYLAVINPNQIDTLVDMGYAKVGDRMSDYGGTVFTDALLGVHEIVSKDIPNMDLYTFRANYIEHAFYDCNYTYATGILLNHVPGKSENFTNPFSYQNEISRAVLGKDVLCVEEKEEKKYQLI